MFDTTFNKQDIFVPFHAIEQFIPLQLCSTTLKNDFTHVCVCVCVKFVAADQTSNRLVQMEAGSASYYILLQPPSLHSTVPSPAGASTQFTELKSALISLCEVKNVFYWYWLRFRASVEATADRAEETRR